jgi:hypothetical protein
VSKVWVLDTETKGTGATMVPLEQTVREPSAEPLYVPPKEEPRAPQPRAPRPPHTFKVVDVLAGETLAEGTPARETVAALEDVASIVDVRVYVREPEHERWRLLTLGEQRALWDFRGRAATDRPAPAR